MSYKWLNNPVVYKASHEISNFICGAVSYGFKYRLKHVAEYDENTDAIMYGVLRGCDKIMINSKTIGRNYVNIDHGYFTDRAKNAHFRFTRNSRTYESKLLDLPADRFAKHNITVKDYKTDGDTIIILPPSVFWGQYSNIDHKTWADTVKKQLEQITDKRIVIKNKYDVKPLSAWWPETYAVIHYSSMGAVEALIEGIPVITLGPSFLSKYGSNQITEIDKIKLIDRTKLFNNLAYNQFSINEIINGTAKLLLNEIYKEIDNG